MRSILEEFFSDKISPEARFFNSNLAYGRAMNAAADIEDKLLARLNDEEKILLDKYTDVQMQLNHLTAVDSQVYGYKLGVLVTAEAFLTGGDLIAGS